LNFYKKEFGAAVKDFKKSYKVKKMYKILDNELAGEDHRDDEIEDADLSDDSQDEDEDHNGKTKENIENQSTNSDKTDLSDVGLCSLNKNEMLFNIILCKIRMGKYAEAKKMATKLLDSCPPKYG
jgi:hypothetical protein